MKEGGTVCSPLPPRRSMIRQKYPGADRVKFLEKLIQKYLTLQQNTQVMNSCL